MSGAIVFLRGMLRDSAQTGAFAPASRSLAQAVADAVPPRTPSEARVARVLEVGAGTGAMSRALAARLLPSDRLDLCEINPRFAAHLRAAFADHAGPQVSVLEQDATRLGGNVRYDVIASSLPLLNMRPESVRHLFVALFGLLAPGGILVYWDYLGKELWSLVGSAASRRRKRDVLDVTGLVLKDHERERRVVWANLPPAVVHYLSL